MGVRGPLLGDGRTCTPPSGSASPRRQWSCAPARSAAISHVLDPRPIPAPCTTPATRQPMSSTLDRILATSTALALTALLSIPGAAQQRTAVQPSAPSASTTDSLLFGALQWRNIGPNR